MLRETWALLVASLLIIQALEADTRILISADASNVERVAAEELKRDIKRVCIEESVRILSYPQSGDDDFEGNSITLGTAASMAQLVAGDPLQPEAFILKTDDRKTVWILGGDDRGVLYGVYEFSERVLGLDALEFWTGKQASPTQHLEIPELDYICESPAFKLRGFKNIGGGLLANWKTPKLITEFETYKEVIDSLARMRFNYVDIGDLLGRPVFYSSDYFSERVDYKVDLELVRQVIDYAHSKGVLVQVPMRLNLEFMHLEHDEICITSHFDRWMELYSYYLRETPLGRADLFALSPTHPIDDHEYRCIEEEAVGLHPGPLFEAVFSGLGKLIQKYRPGGVLICDLWGDGRAMWFSEQMNLRREVAMLWPDDGFARFPEWPESLKAYDFGIYLHAGVMKNQVVQDPYPERIKTAGQNAVSRGMTHNILVHGPGFKPFLFNLEAAARVAWDPSGFDPEDFYREWTSRYFGVAASGTVIESLEHLHDVHFYVEGFRNIMKLPEEILDNLNLRPVDRISLADLRTALALAHKSLELATEAEGLVMDESREVYDDQVAFPCRLMVANLEFAKTMVEFNNAYHTAGDRDASEREELKELLGDARNQLIEFRSLLEQGSRWSKWKGWYAPDELKYYTLPPTLKDLDRVLERL